MPPYRVKLAPRAQKDLRALPPQWLKRVLMCLDNLAERPRGRHSIKLKGYDNQYRARVGDYRIIYEINDKQSIVDAVAVRHRREIYR
ncbi:MAG: type II toxin-antitoxin system RelE/ParE family toxin [Candidatus Zixiibacteriota bacterium]